MIPNAVKSLKEWTSSSLQEFLLWLALLVVIAPLLSDLLRHMAEQPWARYSLIFAALLLIESLRRKGTGTRHASGYVLVTFGLLWISLGIFGGEEFIRFARPGIPLSILGLALVLGHPPVEVALLSIWTIPAPTAVLNILSPQGESLLLMTAAMPLSLLGHPSTLEGGTVSFALGALVLGREDSGLVLVTVLSGLGWWVAIRREATLSGCVRSAICWAPLGIPLQWLAVFMAVALTAAGRPEWAAGLLAHGIWVCTSIIVLAVIFHQQRRAVEWI